MKALRFGASLLTALAVAAGTSALASAQEEVSYPTAEEALRNLPAPFPHCLDAKGVNLCAPAVVILDGEEGVVWAPAWVRPGQEVRCVFPDRPQTPTACAAPGTVRVLVPPRMIITPPAPRN